MSAWERCARVAGVIALLFSILSAALGNSQATAQEITGSLSISLTDGAGNPLGGGCFDVTDAAGVMQSVCDDDGDGNATLGELAEGGATVVETSGPDGYDLASPTVATIIAAEIASITMMSQLIPEPTVVLTEIPTEVPSTPAETATAEPTLEPTEVTNETPELAGTPTDPIETAEPAGVTQEGSPESAATTTVDQFSIAAEVQSISFAIQVYQSTTTDQSSSYVSLPPGGSATAGHWVYAIVSFVGATTPPTGSVDILLTQSTNCVGGDISSWPTVILPDGSILPTGRVQISATGIYNFNARYLGDGDHSPTFSDCGIASFTIGYGTPPTHTISFVNDSNNSSISPGSTIVAGIRLRVDDRLSPIVATPSEFLGNVTFRMYSGSDCSGPSAITTSRLGFLSSGASTARSIPFGMTTAGTFSFQAYYYGTLDAPNAPSYSACSGPITVIKASPTVDLAAIPATLSASETGSTRVILRNSSSPTGTISYVLFNGADCTGDTIQSFGPFGFVGSGPVGIPSPSYQFNQAGAYSWRASYSGDEGNNAATSNCVAVQVLAPSLDISKSASSETVVYGDPLSFTLNVANNGQGSALNVLLTDSLSDWYIWTVDPSTTGLSCSISSGTPVLTCTAESISPEVQATVTVNGIAGNQGCGDIGNFGTVSATNNAQVTSNAVYVRIQCGDLAVFKTADSETVVPGDSIGFTLDTTNYGDAGIYGVTVTDDLGAFIPGLTWMIDSQDEGGICSITDNILTCNWGDFDPFEVRSVHIVSSPVADTSCGEWTNYATGEAVGEKNGIAGNNYPQSTITVTCPDVSITKSAVQEVVSAGSDAVFTIQVTNLGDAAAESVTISDPLPTGLAWIESSDDCSIADGVMSCSVQTLAPQASLFVQLSATTDRDGCGLYENTATVSAINEPPAALENNSATATISVTCPDLSLEKSAETSTITVGDQAVFTIDVSNNGDGSADIVTVTDTLPESIGWYSSNSDCLVIDGVLTCDFGALGPGDTRTVNVTGPTSIDDCGALENTADVSSPSEPEDRTLDNTSSALINVLCPGLNYLKIPDEVTVSAGDEIGFTITIMNTGDGNAIDVIMSDPLPTNPGLSWSIESTSLEDVCEIIDGSVECEFGTMLPASTVSVHIVSPTTAESCGTISNVANIDAANTASGAAFADVFVNCPNVTIQKTAVSDAINAGETIAFSIVVSNPGQGTATGVSVTDVLPAGIAWSENSDDCTISAGTLSCTYSTLAYWGQEEVTVSGVALPGECGIVSNTAEVSASNEPSSANSDNMSTAEVTVNCPNLEVTKTADAETITIGDSIGFTIVVTNGGDGKASEVTATDTLPAEVEWALDGPDSGNCSITDDELSCDFGDLEAGGSRTIHISGSTGGEDCGSISNTASAFAKNESEFDAENNSATATVTITCANVVINKTGDNGDGGTVPLEGACFELVLDNVTFAEKCSDENGKIEFSNIPVKTYLLREISAPQNYQVSPLSASISLEPGETETIDINDGLATVEFPVFAITCISDPGVVDSVSIAAGNLPDGCTVVPGVNFTVTEDAGTPQSFTTGVNGGFIVIATLFSTVVVTEDFSTVPGGFEPAFDQSLLTKTIESVEPGQTGLVFVSVALPTPTLEPTSTPTPGSTSTPTPGSTSTPTPGSTSTPTPEPTSTPVPTAVAPNATPTPVTVSQLPSTGTGPGGMSGSGIGFAMGLLAVLAIAGLVLRSRQSKLKP